MAGIHTYKYTHTHTHTHNMYYTGEKVLDYCAGNGGKTLALAAMVQNQGVRLYALYFITVRGSLIMIIMIIYIYIYIYIRKYIHTYVRLGTFLGHTCAWDVSGVHT
jgi:hypothetical protein